MSMKSVREKPLHENIVLTIGSMINQKNCFCIIKGNKARHTIKLNPVVIIHFVVYVKTPNLRMEIVIWTFHINHQIVFTTNSRQHVAITWDSIFSVTFFVFIQRNLCHERNDFEGKIQFQWVIILLFPLNSILKPFLFNLLNSIIFRLQYLPKIDSTYWTLFLLFILFLILFFQNLKSATQSILHKIVFISIFIISLSQMR